MGLVLPNGTTSRHEGDEKSLPDHPPYAMWKPAMKRSRQQGDSALLCGHVVSAAGAVEGSLPGIQGPLA